ncbi:hypothetical protein [Pseudomonas sp. Snoq117.2]|uniref:hypothetical protein n=1 Tax=Pseudomonas sp. Snoq117.2 TaxID=1500302 RepID=UPI000B85F7B3|nr:hypothetical protein [Pseudomonas sp. Snoq117.2]
MTITKDQLTFNQQSVDAAVETYTAYSVPKTEDVQYTSSTEALIKLQQMVKDGRELYTDEVGNIPMHLVPTFSVIGSGRFVMKRLQSEIDAQVDAYRKTLIAAEEQRVTAAKAAYIEQETQALVAAQLKAEQEVREAEEARRYAEALAIVMEQFDEPAPAAKKTTKSKTV